MLFLLGSITIKISSQKLSSFQNYSHLNILTQNISEIGSFFKFLNGRHFKTKKDFDLKIFMVIHPNDNNVQPEFYKILSICWKVINFFCNLHIQTDRR
jgi:hypothetical protein